MICKTGLSNCEIISSADQILNALQACKSSITRSTTITFFYTLYNPPQLFFYPYRWK